MKFNTNALLIQEVVAEYFDISVENLQSRKRAAEFAQARIIAMYLCYSLMGMSYSQVGRKFDRDHSTVMHAVKWVMERPRMDMHIENLRTMIKERIDVKKNNSGQAGANGISDSASRG